MFAVTASPNGKYCSKERKVSLVKRQLLRGVSQASVSFWGLLGSLPLQLPS